MLCGLATTPLSGSAGAPLTLASIAGAFFYHLQGIGNEVDVLRRAAVGRVRGLNRMAKAGARRVAALVRLLRPQASVSRTQ